jgi:hypothetical protein
VALAIVSVILASVLAGVLYTVLAPRESIQVAANSLAVFDPDNGEPTADLAVGVKPLGVAVAAGSVWVANTDDKTITRLSLSRYELQRTIPVDVYPSDVSATSDGVWVVSGPGGRVFRLGTDNRASKPIQLGYTCRKPAELTTGAGRVWVACDVAPGAFRVDPVRHSATALFRSSSMFSDVAYGRGALWLGDEKDDEVLRVDPTTGRVVRRVKVRGHPIAIAVGGGTVWAVSSGSVSRIESGAATEVAGLRLTVSHPAAVAVGYGAVWVAGVGDRTLTRISLEPKLTVKTIKLSNTPVGLALGAGRLWVTIQAQ